MYATDEHELKLLRKQVEKLDVGQSVVEYYTEGALESVAFIQITRAVPEFYYYQISSPRLGVHGMCDLNEAIELLTLERSPRDNPALFELLHLKRN